MSDDAVFVGRTAELAALTKVADAVRSGQAQVIGVEGAGGMGKSALLRHFLAGARMPTVVAASGEDAESDLPFGVMAQLRAAALVAGEPITTRSRSRQQIRWPVPGPSGDPLEAGSRLLDVLSDLQQTGPVAVVVDDLHWADRQSAQALLFAARRLAFDRVLVLVAYRPAEGTVLTDGWRRLLDGDHAARVRLDGLTPIEVAELGRAHHVTLDSAAARRVVRLTGGSPLHTLALLREADPHLLAAADGPLPVPPSMAGVVRAQLDRCLPDTARLVTAAAVLGERARLADVVAVAGLADAPAGQVSQARAAGLLKAAPDTAEVAFPHALIRAAVLASLDDARRIELHLRAAHVLAGPDAIAHRVAACAGTDNALADDLMRLADERSGAGDVAGAGRYRLQAAKVSSPGPLRDARVLAGVEDLLDAGDLAHALTTLDELSAVPACARRSAILGDVALWLGKFEEAETALSEAWKRLDGERGAAARNARLTVTVAVQLAFLMLLTLRFDEAARWAETTLRVAGDSDVIVGPAAEILSAAGRGDQANSALAGLGPAELVPPTQLHRLSARGVIRMHADDLAGARADLGCALARAQAGEPHRLPGRVAGRLGEACYRAGNLDEAIVYSELACAMADEVGRGWDFAFMHGIAALPRAARGDFGEARGHFQEALLWARAAGSSAAIQFATLAAGAMAAAGCDDEDILHVAALHPVYAEPGVHAIGPAAADALLSLGRFSEAQAWLADYEAQAVACSRRSALAGTARVRGRLAAARGRADAAFAAFESGLQHLAGLGQPLEEARLRLDYADALLSASLAAAARTQYSAAAALAEPMRAAPYLDRAQAGLARARGKRRSAPSAAQPTALSPQERTIANLVAEGLSNREIGARLALSVKTIEYHLSNAYDKLGIRSRAALAARVGRL